MTIYLIIGVFIALILCVSAQLETKYFTEQLGFRSFIAVVTNVTVIFAFCILTLLWPFAIIKIIITNFK